MVSMGIAVYVTRCRHMRGIGFLFISLVLWQSGCVTPTWFILHNNSQYPIVLVLDHSDAGSEDIYYRPVCRVLPGERSGKFTLTHPGTALVFTEENDTLFAYDLRKAFAFFNEYPELRHKKVTIRVEYENNGNLVIPRRDDQFPSSPLLILKPRRTIDLLREVDARYTPATLFNGRRVPITLCGRGEDFCADYRTLCRIPPGKWSEHFYMFDYSDLLVNVEGGRLYGYDIRNVYETFYEKSRKKTRQRASPIRIQFLDNGNLRISLGDVCRVIAPHLFLEPRQKDDFLGNLHLKGRKSKSPATR